MENHLKQNQIIRLLELIEDVNRSIELEKDMKSGFLLKQNLNLKKEYSLELFSLLSEYQLPIELVK